MLKSKLKPDVPYTAPKDLEEPPSDIPLKSFEDRYEILADLGSGTFGTVVLAQKLTESHLSNNHSEGNPPKLSFKSDSLVAIKIVKQRLPKIRDYRKLKELIFLFQMPPHPQLVKMFEVFVDDSTYHLRIVMEPMAQNLCQLMRSRPERLFSTATLRSISAQLLAAIRHIHKNSFLHRDIKPENILVTHRRQYYSSPDNIPKKFRGDKYVIKLADYGLTRSVFDNGRYTSYVATRWYRAPEILLRLGYYSQPLDIWSFGCVVSEIATFEPLFRGKDELDQILKVLEVIGSPHLPPEVDPDRSSCSYYYQTLGGNWENASGLFSRLGLQPMYFPGVILSDIFVDSSLEQVLFNCLKWDPNRRATAPELAEMSFFRHNIHLKVETGVDINEEKELNEELDEQQPIWDKRSINNLLSEQILRQLSPNKIANTDGKQSDRENFGQVERERLKFEDLESENENQQCLGSYIDRVEKLSGFTEIKSSNLWNDKEDENEYIPRQMPMVDVTDWDSYQSGPEANSWKEVDTSKEMKPFMSEPFNLEEIGNF